ncbi:hypothetical protein BH23ACT3_BH23ACT3_06050 [soil metagenome]
MQADRAQIVESRTGPSDHYVNVHAGEPGMPGSFRGIRGQLERSATTSGAGVVEVVGACGR